MYFKQIFEEKLAQYAYLIGCQQTKEAIIIDPMRDIDRYYDLAKKERLKIVAAADTHIHADYLTGLREFAEDGVKILASGEGGEDWKYEWLAGSDYNYQLLKDGDRFNIGHIQFEARHTPGHTPEHISYLLTDGAGADQPMGILSGDFVFVGDVGRPDLLESAAGVEGAMESSARTLYHSVEKFKSMPEYLQLWPGHGAGSACGKALGAVPESTVGYELRFNPSIRASDSEQHFVDYILDGQPEPPLYFARMKAENRGGPAVLGKLPRPGKMEAGDVVSLANEEGKVVLDTRDKLKFMQAHIKGSLLSPFNKQFNTIAGSYINKGETIYLIIDEENVEEAVRDLVRIGLDDIAGYITPEELEAYGQKEDGLESIETIDFDRVAKLLKDDENRVLDVRKATEFNAGHIAGAENIAHTRLADREKELDKDKTWLVHCKSGGRASVAAAQLESEGYKVKYIKDKIEKWPDKVEED
ncbi:MAG TPA: MBL fold metallo-hydrolase [Balneolaceae bacterium]|nr:MBL fold metallo-hydrolase [Balneolaceae bacterium]